MQRGRGLGQERAQATVRACQEAAATRLREATATAQEAPQGEANPV